MPKPVLHVHIVPPAPEAYRQEGLPPGTAVCSLGSTHFRVAFAKRLHLRIENGARTSRNVTLTLTGSAPRMMDHPYLRDARSGEWHPVAGLPDGDSVHVDLRIPPGHAERFLWLAPSFKEHLKRWGVDKSRPGTLAAYCRRRDPACVACTFEFPWFARTTADMRSIGPGVLETLLNTRIQVQEQARKPDFTEPLNERYGQQ